MTIREFLDIPPVMVDEEHGTALRRHIICKDGFSLSVQASAFHYSVPRKIVPAEEYKEVEIGKISSDEPMLHDYSDCIKRFPGKAEYKKSVFVYVPVEVAEAIVEKHGGIEKII